MLRQASGAVANIERSSAPCRSDPDHRGATGAASVL